MGKQGPWVSILPWVAGWEYWASRTSPGVSPWAAPGTQDHRNPERDFRTALRLASPSAPTQVTSEAMDGTRE